VDVHVDTGSARLLVVSVSCADDECDKSTAFASAASTSFTGSDDDVSAYFAAHSRYTGVWAQDSVSLGSWRLDEYRFGLVDSTVNDSNAPSILGLGWESEGNPSVARALAKEWSEPLFGMYLARAGAGAHEVANGSLMTFG
jgi:hypothetical protein